ncbi:NAD(P)H-binding protein [Symbioplanes lichenis]|uniref:NAD(P)H-binding protein n=1 Tax=Symbioplanes lichenis TaxID=1629072 RepID=UPI00273A5401|nr:NAD(P)H-binding protein [Actinoplanes lichenis]
MKILVTGATGNVGRLVVDELLALGATDVRALTAKPGAARLPAPVEVFRGWIGRPETVAPALRDVDHLYLAPHLPTNAEVCRLAAAAGVRRIVDLAGAKDGEWRPIEEGVEATGVPYVHLEPGEFMPNALMWAAQLRAGDVVRDGYGESRSALIALEDIAAVAARCLVEEGHEGRSYELTGPATLTRRERVAQLGVALGRELHYVDLPRETFIAELTPAMGEYAAWYVDGLEALVDHPQPVSPAVAEVTGRAGTTFLEWARANMAAFR